MSNDKTQPKLNRTERRKALRKVNKSLLTLFPKLNRYKDWLKTLAPGILQALSENREGPGIDQPMKEKYQKFLKVNNTVVYLLRERSKLTNGQGNI